jgi:chromosome partitioning protein
MRVWAVANQKGGVGKTTTAVSLGGLLAARGESTLLVDLDPHGSLTAYFGMDPERATSGVYDLFRQTTAGGVHPETLVHETRFPHLQVMPASTAMATLDRQLGGREGMGLVLHRALTAMTERFDTVILDCPPMLGVLMVNALAACNRLLIPVQTETLALKGLERMLHTLDMIQRSRRIRMDYLVVPTMFDRRTRASVQSLRKLRAEHADTLWEGMVPVDTQFREASTAGIPLPLMQPDARGVEAYDWLLRRLERDEKQHRAAS